MKAQKELFDFREPITHERMMGYLDRLGEQYPFIGITGLGESVLGRGIPLITLGEGEKSILYVGAHSGTEWMTTVVLLRFLHEYAEIYRNEGRIFQYSLPYLFSTRTIYIVPMLNPDGVEYVQHGIDTSHILYDRVHAMNGESEDFGDWQANARGVELTRNYSYGFVEQKRRGEEMGIFGGSKCGFCGEMPESEPEIGLLCNFLRYNQGIHLAIALHMGKDKILHTTGTKTASRANSIGRAIARMTGYPLTLYDGWESAGGMSAWCVDALDLPAFSLVCDHAEDGFRAYAALREMLFVTPTMI